MIRSLSGAVIGDCCQYPRKSTYDNICRRSLYEKVQHLLYRPSSEFSYMMGNDVLIR